MAERRDVIKNKKAILQGYIDMTSEKMMIKSLSVMSLKRQMYLVQLFMRTIKISML